MFGLDSLFQSVGSAMKNGSFISFDIWDQNTGVAEMRKIVRETERGSKERRERARLAFPHIKKQWLNLVKVNDTPMIRILPQDMIDVISGMFDRMRTDPTYANRMYDIFPDVADRYGKGTNKFKEPRQSLTKIVNDPDLNPKARTL